MSEVPFAEWAPADASNYAPRLPTASPFDLIVIHGTSGHDNPDNVAAMWQEPRHGSSAHFVIGNESGRIVQCVPLRYAAYHAHHANGHSIGIEHCMREPGELGHDDPGLPPSDALYAASARLVAYLAKACGKVPSRDWIKGHAEVDPQTTHTGCPLACGWEWDKYMALVADEYARLA